VSSVANMNSMFSACPLSTQNYDSLLCGWSQLNLVNNVNFDGGWSTYCNSNQGRQYIIDTFNWNISDGGLYDESCNQTETCNSTEIEEHLSDKSLVQITNILGKETNKNKGFQLHIYDDGSVEKRYIIE